MEVTNTRVRQAKILRIARKVHRTTGALLFVFFFFISITGLLLGWKKHSGDALLAKSRKGSSTNLAEWLSIDSLHRLAAIHAREHIGPAFDTTIDRIDVRPDKGMVKFTFVSDFVGLQLDGATGKLLHIEKRRADFVENVHDGSILDRYFNTSNGQIKLVYTSVMGVALFIFTVTGFWLWYGPKRMRSRKS
ncbi:MAG: PepSY domain-containing protein [Gemmatimonadaceae bacterium]|nr:PepSY domain-containing protein [Chitinophagaceae bacterium]